MLSRKQVWRKIKSRRKPLRNEYPLNEAGDKSIDCAAQTKASHDEIHVKSSTATTTDKKLLKVPVQQPVEVKKRNVNFCRTVRVCLVPSRVEYRTVFHKLYWAPHDYTNFKREAVKELREYWKLSNSTVKEAISALYQPQPDIGVYLPPHGKTAFKHVDSVANFRIEEALELEEDCGISLLQEPANIATNPIVIKNSERKFESTESFDTIPSFAASPDFVGDASSIPDTGYRWDSTDDLTDIESNSGSSICSLNQAAQGDYEQSVPKQFNNIATVNTTNKQRECVPDEIISSRHGGIPSVTDVGESLPAVFARS